MHGNLKIDVDLAGIFTDATACQMQAEDFRHDA